MAIDDHLTPAQRIRKWALQAAMARFALDEASALQIAGALAAFVASGRIGPSPAEDGPPLAHRGAGEPQP